MIQGDGHLAPHTVTSRYKFSILHEFAICARAKPIWIQLYMTRGAGGHRCGARE